MSGSAGWHAVGPLALCGRPWPRIGRVIPSVDAPRPEAHTSHGQSTVHVCASIGAACPNALLRSRPRDGDWREEVALDPRDVMTTEYTCRRSSHEFAQLPPGSRCASRLPQASGMRTALPAYLHEGCAGCQTAHVDPDVESQLLVDVYQGKCRGDSHASDLLDFRQDIHSSVGYTTRNSFVYKRYHRNARSLL
jgi:hypothetical protein